jgi:hypothetical protein
MAAHLQEAPVIGPLLADEDGLHRRLHVMGWTPPFLRPQSWAYQKEG